MWEMKVIKADFSKLNPPLRTLYYSGEVKIHEICSQ